ncbi:MAG: hypothetical protein RMK99_00145 [Anaerolineales bacterium]|nr:hypothetical protein [Anaerolineales bacterium]
MDTAHESAVREQYRMMKRMGFTVYRTGVEYPPLSEDEYVEAAQNAQRVDLCRERDGRILFWDNLVIRP